MRYTHLVIVRLDRRELIRVDVTANQTADWIAHQVTEAFPWDDAPQYLIRDRDLAYGAIVTRRLGAMGIRDKPIAPASPWQNSFAERLIGSIRRECVDHLIVLSEAHLRRRLRAYARYYNNIRTHWSVAKDAPVSRPIQRTGGIRSDAILGGLHHHYVRFLGLRYRQGYFRSRSSPSDVFQQSQLGLLQDCNAAALDRSFFSGTIL